MLALGLGANVTIKSVSTGHGLVVRVITCGAREPVFNPSAFQFLIVLGDLFVLGALFVVSGEWGVGSGE